MADRRIPPSVLLAELLRRRDRILPDQRAIDRLAQLRALTPETSPARKEGADVWSLLSCAHHNRHEHDACSMVAWSDVSQDELLCGCLRPQNRAAIDIAIAALQELERNG